jgi:hypothetical protein
MIVDRKCTRHDVVVLTGLVGIQGEGPSTGLVCSRSSSGLRTGVSEMVEFPALIAAGLPIFAILFQMASTSTFLASHTWSDMVHVASFTSWVCFSVPDLTSLLLN